MQLLDLSVLINNKTPVYPGDPATLVAAGGKLVEDGYQDHYLSIGTHAGTHVDAPSHMLAGGININQIPLENFCGRGVCVEVGQEMDVAKLKLAGIREGDIVLLRTGMSEVYYQAEYYDNYPDLSRDIIDYLVEMKVKAVGVDMCSIDHEPFSMHKIILGNNILIIENLTNLQTLTGKSFRVYAFPLKLQVDGAPARVVAEMD